jgi:hypothetical protein
MIGVEKYKVILDQGLLLDHYLLLSNLKEGKEMVQSKRVQGFINLMHKKGYIDEGILTQKALDLLDGEVVPLVRAAPVRTTAIAKFDYADWVISLHAKCEAKLLEITGKRQARGRIDGKTYPFLPNSTDLGKVLLRAINHYKLKDFDAIERVVLRYVEKCARAERWFPILGYYIMKGGNSTASMTSMMVTDLGSEEEESQEDSGVNI